ncbi:hypothetical protein JXZ92_01385 [Mycoplasma sp. CSL10137]|uniref:TyrS-associated PheT N-terminal domain-related protein TapR n=1 Tax=unclassified Mycoplasma TaxID=2683645 RepID=UPI00197C07E6|nr:MULTISPECIES: hypothetical protein [unclassified Mycoplasma]MBN4083473.1 hypothetical protein [Mycoplasma sp. CSL10137]MBN4084596.1 hypothetical protein [Mycoplasma sp. CSL10166]
MIICNVLNENFANTSIVFVNSNIKKINKIYGDKIVFFVDENKNVSSINILDNKKYFIENNNKFFRLSSEQINIIKDEANKLGLVIKPIKMFQYGKILKRTIHEKSNKLFVLEVNFNEEKTTQIITNTLDTLEGKVCVFARIGATTFSGLEILSGKVMNIESNGMVTSYKTLGIERDGLIFGDETQVGQEFDLCQDI